jgi:hypothetical protein
VGLRCEVDLHGSEITQQTLARLWRGARPDGGAPEFSEDDVTAIQERSANSTDVLALLWEPGEPGEPGKPVSGLAFGHELRLDMASRAEKVC